MANNDDFSKLNTVKNAGRGAKKVVRKGLKKAGKASLKGLIGSASLLSPNGLFSVFVKTIPGIILVAIFIIFLMTIAEESGINTGKSKNLIDNKNRGTIGSTSYSDESSSSGSGSSASSQSSAPNGNETGDDVAVEALNYVGGTYVWGGEDPAGSGADCSGFTKYVMAKFGVSLPHDAASQSTMGEEVPLSDIQAGDLLFYVGNSGGIGHVTIYLGGGQVVHASNSQPYPQGGIKISDYGYRAPVKARRFLAAGSGDHSVDDITSTTPSVSSLASSSTEDSETKSDTALSPANAAALTFYTEVSEKKSTWQISDTNSRNSSTILADKDNVSLYDDVTGDVLVRADSQYAVSDYFKNDQKYFVSPYLLYSMNEQLWGDSYTYPEAFLNPVAHESDYSIKELTDDKGALVIESNERDKKGNLTGNKIKSTADYGVASILKYKTEIAKDAYKGTYIKEDYYDIISGTIKQRDISEEYEIVINEEERNVLDWVQTFQGNVKYNYSPTSVLVEGVRDGESRNESDNVRKIFYKKETVSVYIVVPRANGTGSTAYAVGVIADFDTAVNYCKNHPQYTLYGAEYDDDGIITSATSVNKSYNLYKYRSDNSGKYSNFVDISSTDTVQQGNEYLREYLGNFDSYKPTSIVRDTEIFQKFTSFGDASYRSSSSSSGGTGAGASGGGDFAACFSDDTIGERIRVIWDTALAWGYSEEQAAAILGNWWYESGGAYDPTATNPTTGAYGICQWLGGRYTNLYNFASGYFNESDASFESQVLFAMMELDYNNSYTWTACEWLPSGTSQPNGTYSYAQLCDYWNNSSDISELTLAICQGWERPGDDDGSLDRRVAFAEDAFRELSGQSFGLSLEIIEPSSSSGDSTGSSINHSASTKSMSEKDRIIYNDFYNAANGIYDGSNTMAYYTKGLTTELQEQTLLLASSLSRGVSMEEVRLDLGQELWEDGYIVNVTAIDELQSYGSTLDSVDLASVSDMIDYGFMWPLAKDADGGSWLNSQKFSSRFGPRVSPVAGGSSNHKGLDVAVGEGASLVAVSSGTVEYVGWQNASNHSEGAGYYVLVNHGEDAQGRTVKTGYYHMTADSAVVSVGDTVEKGQKLGLSGNTGASSGPHLHLDVIVNGIKYNPLAFYDLTKVPMVDTAGSSNLEDVNFTSVGSLPSDIDTSYKEYLYFDGSNYVEW